MFDGRQRLELHDCLTDVELQLGMPRSSSCCRHSASSAEPAARVWRRAMSSATAATTSRRGRVASSCRCPEIFVDVPVVGIAGDFPSSAGAASARSMRGSQRVMKSALRSAMARGRHLRTTRHNPFTQLTLHSNHVRFEPQRLPLPRLKKIRTYHRKERDT